MAERLGARSRLIDMRLCPVRRTLFGMALVLPLLAGCGNDSVDPAAESTATTHACLDDKARATAVELMSFDLDGDGTAEAVSYVPRTSTCTALLVATMAGDESAVALEGELPVAAEGSFAITIPGRVGQVAVVRQEHPRGGFQVTLLGWASGALSTLTADDAPIFPFVATDALSTPLSASCTPDGFAVTEARAHQPIGVAPAWDVYRTTYTVAGNTVTKRADDEVADNVLTGELEAKYQNLVTHVLFENCRATG